MKVKFLPLEKEFEIKSGETLLELAQREKLPIYSVCHGMPSCAECRVTIKEGELSLLPPNQKERDLIGSGYFVDGRRLACQVKCLGDIVVDLTEQIEKSNLRQNKRPQGYVTKNHTEKSYAVSGNLINQDDDFDKTEWVSDSSSEEGSSHESKFNDSLSLNSKEKPHLNEFKKKFVKKESRFSYSKSKVPQKQRGYEEKDPNKHTQKKQGQVKQKRK